MRISRFTIEGRLPGLNEIIGKARLHYWASASQKKKYTELCRKAASGLSPFLGPVTVRIFWFEPNRRRDVDNIGAAAKFVLDGIVRANVLPDDNQDWVTAIAHEVLLDREHPRVEVELTGER